MSKLRAAAAVLILGSLPFWGILSDAGSVAAQRHVMPGGYTIPPRFQPVSLPAVTAVEQLLPAVESCLHTWAGVTVGDRLRIVTDESVPTLVTDAFRRVTRHQGLDVHWHEAPLSGLEERQISQLESEDDFDATLLLAYFPEEPLPPRRDQRIVRVIAIPELLASEWASVPLPVMEEVALQTQSVLSRQSSASIIDPAGTDFSFEYRTEQLPRDAIREELLSQFPPSFRPVMSITATRRAAGTMLTHSRPLNFFPLLQLDLKDAVVTRVRGGGSLGEGLRSAQLNPFSSVSFSKIRLGTSSRAIRYTRGYRDSPYRYGQEVASQRAGVATFEFETVSRGPAQAAELHQFQVFFPTMKVGGQTIVETGFLKSFEHPEVLTLAASMGATHMLVAQCGAESLPKLPDHTNPVIRVLTEPTAMTPAIQSNFSEWVQLGADEKVLILTDASVPPLLFGATLEAMGTDRQIDIADLPALQVAEDPAELLQAYENFQLSEEVWNQVAAADVVVALSYFPYQRLRRGEQSLDEWLQSVETRFFGAAGLPEIFASPWGTFPIPLFRQVARYTVSRARLSSSLSLATREGSELKFDYDPPRSIPRILPEPGHYRYHPAPANFFFSLEPAQLESASGRLTARRLEGLAVPPLVMTIEGGKVTTAEGGGPTGEWLRQRMSERGEVRLRRVGTYVNPKAFPWEECPYPGWTPSFWARSGNIFRSGIVHIEFEGSVNFSVQLQIARLELGSRELISQGRLLVLEDPNLHRFANQQGVDPEQWLKEDWMPIIGR